MNHTTDTETFHGRLKQLMDEYAHLVYRLTRSFPREELYGMTSQLRRAALSVVLNYVEGYARGKDKVHKNFLEISYGSLQESKYLVRFAHDEKYLNDNEFKRTNDLGEEIGAMLWGVISRL